MLVKGLRIVTCTQLAHIDHFLLWWWLIGWERPGYISTLTERSGKGGNTQSAGERWAALWSHPWGKRRKGTCSREGNLHWWQGGRGGPSGTVRWGIDFKYPICPIFLHLKNKKSTKEITFHFLSAVYTRAYMYMHKSWEESMVLTPGSDSSFSSLNYSSFLRVR